MIRITTLLGMALLAATATAGDFSEEAKQELAKLAGTWRVVSSERDGKLEANPPEPVIVQVKNEQLWLGERDVGLRIAAIFPAASPRLLDISHAETKKKFEGIYELTDDQWRICLNTEGEGAQERPTDFATQGKSKFITVVLKRDKR